VALPIRDFKLLTSGAGWVSTGSQLLFTTDNGAHWKDISPPNPNGDSLSGVFFLDADTGWVLFSHDIREGENPTPDSPDNTHTFTVSATFDGGATWTTENLPAWQGDRGLSDQGVIAFADKQHGWLSLGVEGNTLMAYSTLLVTSDGGRTWKRTKTGSDGRVDAMLAVTGQDVWFVGHGDGSKLDVSHDGANSMQEISLPAPKEIAPAEYPTYSLPVFEDKLHGYEAVTYSGGFREKSAAVLFATDDGGRTWKPDRILSNLAESSVGEVTSSTVAGSSWIHSFTLHGSQPTLMKLPPMSGTTDGASSEVNYNNCGLSFRTPMEGWANCSGNLSSTIDGGASWTSITPRHRNGVLTSDPLTPIKTMEIQTKTIHPPGMAKSRSDSVAPLEAPPNHIAYGSGVDQHLGFDSYNVPSTDIMATWWASSPYYDVALYVPHSPNRHNDPTLIGHDGNDGVAWVDAVVGQGWGIIPIWFGLQAPCACDPIPANESTTFGECHLFTGKISWNPESMTEKDGKVKDGAEAQGKAQAIDATKYTQALGLDGSIIYTDIEQYTSSIADPSNKKLTCGAAVQAYVKGWVEQMSAQGGSVGIYGGSAAAQADFGADSGFMPQDVWVGLYDDRVTVWHLNHGAKLGDPDRNKLLDDGLWINKQRIHQYQQNVTEIWGGKKYPIDRNLVDATIVPSSGVKDLLFSTPVVIPGLSGLYVNGGGANGINDGATLQLGPAVGLGNNGGFVYTSFSSSGWPYPAGVSDLPNPPNGFVGNDPGPSAINNLGQVIGSFYDSNYDDNGFVHGFLYTPGSKSEYLTLDYPESSPCSFLTSINDAGWVAGVWQDTSQDNQFCGNWNNPQHCLLWKPPYTSAISFDSFGGVANCGQVNGLYSGPYINGLGQFAGASAFGQIIDVSWGVGSAVFIDDAQSGVPGPADGENALTAVAAPSETSYSAAGLNNNGQIAGTEENGQWISGPHGSVWEPTSVGGLFIDTNGAALPLNSDPEVCGTFVSINDDVQIMTDGGCVIDTLR
jgi:probable HAF family extracellular repeat protein